MKLQVYFFQLKNHMVLLNSNLYFPLIFPILSIYMQLKHYTRIYLLLVLFFLECERLRLQGMTRFHSFISRLLSFIHSRGLDFFRGERLTDRFDG